MTFTSRFLPAAVLVLFCSGAREASARTSATASDPLISKSIPKIFAVGDRFFAFDEYGKSFSNLDLFPATPQIKNGTWPWPGVVADGVAWKTSLLLRSDSISDSVRVARVAALGYDGTFKRNSGNLINNHLIFPVKDSTVVLSHNTGLTAMAVWHDTLVLGFGKLGIAYAGLAPDTGATLFTDSNLAFSSLPAGADTTFNLLPHCVWDRICRADTVPVPGGSDSVLTLAVDSSAPDSIWLLVATRSGLRRGLLGSRNFPHVSGISNSDAVLNLVVEPDHHLLWAFTNTRFFFSKDHGRSFHVPDTVSGIHTAPSLLQAYASIPQAAIRGDTTFVNFNLARPGLVIFKQDSLRRVNPDTAVLSDVLLDASDSLNITAAEGSLTALAIARRDSSGIGQFMLVAGSTVKGIFYRRLDGTGTAFSNLNLLRQVKTSLNEVITFPTLFGSEMQDGMPKPVHLGYRLAKDGKVTITVFNYAMEKVRTLVRNAPRKGGIARSENPAEDKWDGTDASGRYVSVGVYYILVESDQGERGFGKAISVWGHK